MRGWKDGTLQILFANLIIVMDFLSSLSRRLDVVLLL